MSFNRLIGAVLGQRPLCRRMERAKYLGVSAHVTKGDSSGKNETPSEESFSDLFQRSKFATVLDPVNQNVEGEVLAIADGNMYVDFGCKFHAVVPVPKGERTYEKGSKVVVRVLDLEMTDHFVGDHRDTSLLEAEAQLVA